MSPICLRGGLQSCRHHHHAFHRRRTVSIWVRSLDEDDVGTDSNPLTILIESIPYQLTVRGTDLRIRELPDNSTPQVEDLDVDKSRCER